MSDAPPFDALAETIPSAVTASIAARRDAEAVVTPERRVTYGELGELVHTSTRAMMAAGVERGDRVAIWAPNGLGWIAAALGAQFAGAALVPINTRFKGEEAAYVLSASKAATLVTTVGFLGTDTVGMLRAAETPLPHLRRIVVLEGSATATEGPEGRRRGALARRSRPEPKRSPPLPLRRAGRACGRRTRATSCSRPAPPGAPRAWS